MLAEPARESDRTGRRWIMRSVELAFLVRHRYAVLFVAVLAEQLGLPVPAAPFLLAAGALAGMGQLDLGAALAVAVLAAGLSDVFWFELGRRRGARILS